MRLKELVAVLAAILGVPFHSSQSLALPYRFLPNPSFYLPAAHTILEAGRLNPAYVSDLEIAICRNGLVDFGERQRGEPKSALPGQAKRGESRDFSSTAFIDVDFSQLLAESGSSVAVGE